MFAIGLILLLLFFNVQPVYSQDQSQVDLSEIEKEIEKTAAKPYSLGGFFEFQPITFGVDRDNAFARTNYDLVRSGSTFEQYNLRLRLEGSYKKDILSVSFQTDTLVQYLFQGWPHHPDPIEKSSKQENGMRSLL